MISLFTGLPSGSMMSTYTVCSLHWQKHNLTLNGEKCFFSTLPLSLCDFTSLPRGFPHSTPTLQELQKASADDPTLSKLVTFITQGGPNKAPEELSYYFRV